MAHITTIVNNLINKNNMKSTTSELKIITMKPFPKLMVTSRKTIVLFTSKFEAVLAKC